MISSYMYDCFCKYFYLSLKCRHFVIPGQCNYKLYVWLCKCFKMSHANVEFFSVLYVSCVGINSIYIYDWLCKYIIFVFKSRMWTKCQLFHAPMSQCICYVSLASSYMYMIYDWLCKYFYLSSRWAAASNTRIDHVSMILSTPTRCIANVDLHFIRIRLLYHQYGGVVEIHPSGWQRSLPRLS